MILAIQEAKAGRSQVQGWLCQLRETDQNKKLKRMGM